MPRSTGSVLTGVIGGDAARGGADALFETEPLREREGGRVITSVDATLSFWLDIARREF